VTFTHVIDLAAQGFEVAGAAVLVIGLASAVIVATRAWLLVEE